MAAGLAAGLAAGGAAADGPLRAPDGCEGRACVLRAGPDDGRDGGFEGFGAVQTLGLTSFTPRSLPAREGAGGQAAQVAVPLGSPLGIETGLTVSGGHFTLPGRPGETGMAAGASISALGIEVGGRYFRPEDGGPEGVALGASVTRGAWLLGGGVALGLAAETAGEPSAANVEVRYSVAPGLSVGGALEFTEPADQSSDGAVSAGMLLRLNF